MKKAFLKLLKSLIDWLTHFYEKISITKNINHTYKPLSPTSEAKNIKYYVEALNWALENRNIIKNIAITGPFGSGKSSILQTFQKKTNIRNFHPLSISLATFKERNKNDNNKEDDLLRLIEFSILQQLFYHEEDKNIPDSRFKKIRNNTRVYLFLLTIGIIFFFIALTNLIYPNFVQNILSVEFSNELETILQYLSLIFTLLGLGFLIYKSIRPIRGLAIKKLNIKNAEIEIDESVTKSVLNHHIDEILYFFEATKYNAVIIEDLDRFDKTEVFTKLREINLLINNSNKTKDVVFIYAVKDDMFVDNDRTKFFDFIIPIIPVINFSNSNEIILEIIKQNNYKISSDLIDDISLFIEDMRLLYNIMNEYHLYSKNLSGRLDQDKLLSMIIYKNIYPEDFTSLLNNEGVLFETLSDKKTYIKQQIEELEKKESHIKNEIDELESIRLKDLNELRTVYLAKIIEKIGNRGFKHFSINNRNYNLTQATEENIFQEMLENNSIYYVNSRNQRENLNISPEEIENEVDANKAFKHRQELISGHHSNKSETLKKELEKIEQAKRNIRKSKIKDLLSDGLIESELGDLKQKNLINILLRNGYVDEDYLDYISIFYEGSLSKEDHQFLLNIKTQNNTDFEYKLTQIENLIHRINPYEFEKEYVLNYELVDCLLKNPGHKKKLERVFLHLTNENDKSIKFIDGFIDQTTELELFIKCLCKSWLNIWNYIENESDFTKDKKNKYFKLIVECAEIVDISEIFKDHTKRVANDENFLNIISDKQRLKLIIEILNIKFTVLSVESPDKLLDYIYEGNYYAITPQMVEFILKYKSSFAREEFINENYHAIKSSSLSNLIQYIEQNIDDYVSSVYLQIEPNSDEPQSTLIELLNNVKISNRNKKEVVNKTDTKVMDIDEIEDLKVIKILLNASKVEPNWNNIISAYIRNEDTFSDEMIAFINNAENSITLSKNRIEKDYLDEETVKKFRRAILLNNAITNVSYSNILQSIPYIYPTLNLVNLSKEKVLLLIENKKLSMSQNNYDILKSNFENLHIVLVETNSKTFLDHIESFDIENEDILALLQSKNLALDLKAKLINSFDHSIYSNDLEIINQIGHLLSDNNLQIKLPVVKLVLTQSDLKTLQKVGIFNNVINELEKSVVSDILLSLDKPYSDIARLGKRPLIKSDRINEKLAVLLERKEYISSFKKTNDGIRINTFNKN